ncbi:putative transcription factor interactor and regulator CCHC(Zn) family [Helianthus anomalus]
MKPPGWSLNDLHQFHPDDVEEMDITWQMAMAAFRAHKFAQKTGRNKWEVGISNSARVPFTLRCYNSHEPGHVTRNCTKPSIYKEQTHAQLAPPNSERALVTTNDSSTAASGSTQSSALTASENIAFMTSASKDRNSAPDDEVPAENLALLTRILSAPVHGLTAEEVCIFCTTKCRERVEALLVH